MSTECAIDSSLTTAEEILKYDEEEFKKTLKTKEKLLIRKGWVKPYLSVIVAVSYIGRKV
ncbi:MAG: hypothetical protein QXP84_03020 [Candidatus Korarchaeum sp.]